ncbi:hypothetical protein PICSAR71_00230 [Mycobacterium avium subsp. paratuberculosis]|nr:hypothetical protein PICSAR71_00230 [Mycobacterium avium subsp. paratuberculosis]
MRRLPKHPNDFSHRWQKVLADLDAGCAQRPLEVLHLGVVGLLGFGESLGIARTVGLRLTDLLDRGSGFGPVLPDQLQYRPQIVLAADHEGQRLDHRLDITLAGLELIVEACQCFFLVPPLLDKVGFLNAQAAAVLAELLVRLSIVLDRRRDRLRLRGQLREHLISAVGHLLALEPGVQRDHPRRAKLRLDRVIQQVRGADQAALPEMLLNVTGIQTELSHLLGHLLGWLGQRRDRVRHILGGLISTHTRLSEHRQRRIQVIDAFTNSGRDRLDVVQRPREVLQRNLRQPHGHIQFRGDVGGLLDRDVVVVHRGRDRADRLAQVRALFGRKLR